MPLEEFQALCNMAEQLTSLAVEGEIIVAARVGDGDRMIFPSDIEELAALLLCHILAPLLAARGNYVGLVLLEVRVGGEEVEAACYLCHAERTEWTKWEKSRAEGYRGQ